MPRQGVWEQRSPKRYDPPGSGLCCDAAGSIQARGIILRLSYPQSVWAQLDTTLWPVLIAATAAALLLMALLAIVLRRQWIGPIHELAEATDRMASGQWDARGRRGAEDLRFFSHRLNLAAEHAERQLRI